MLPKKSKANNSHVRIHCQEIPGPQAKPNIYTSRAAPAMLIENHRPAPWGAKGGSKIRKIHKHNIQH